MALADATLERGASLGRYLVLDRIGQGGMGVVYAAYDPELDRRVAIKLLRPDSNSAAAESRRVRLQREAQAMARLSHANVITVHDVGTAGDQVFVAMELVDGRTLKKWLAEKRRPWREVVDVLVQAGRGLAAAHDAGLVHRDFKPDNVLVGKDGKVRVTDFGLARATGEEGDPSWPTGSPTSSSPGALAVKLTETGAVMGTPAYMAPEQHRGRQADARADQFAFSVALYEGLYGKHPFRTEVSETAQTIEAASPDAADEVSTADALALEVVQGRVRPPPSDRDVPSWLRRVVMRGLATEPKDRYPTMHQLLAGLAHDPGTARRRAILLGGALLALAAVAGVGLFGRRVGLFGAGEGNVCGGAAERMVGVWDASVREQVRKGFQASGSPHADAAFANVARALDAYTAAWTDMHLQTCRATRVTREQSETLLDVRMSCLERRRAELAALVKLFAQADAEIVRKSVDAVAQLPLVTDCARSDALLARLPPPESTKAAVLALETRRAEVAALGDAGKYAIQIEQAKKLAEDARALGYAPLTAQALLLLGRSTKVSGDFHGAEAIYQEAIGLAATGRDDDTMIDSLVELAMMNARQLDNQAAATALAMSAKAAADRSGADDLHRGRVTVAQADVDYYAGRHEQALAGYQAAFNTAERIYGPDSPRLVLLITDIGDTMRGLGRPAEARPYYERMLAITEKAYGPDHPSAATALYNLGLAAREQGHFDEARDYLKRAIPIGEKVFGHESVNMANYAAALAYCELVQGHLDEANRLYQLSYDIRVKKMGPEASLTIASLEGIAHVRAAEGRREEALDIYRQVLAVKEKTKGNEINIANTLRNLSTTLSRLDRYDEAVPLAERGIAALRKAMGDQHPQVAAALAGLGQIHVNGKRCDRARPLLTEALAILEKPEHADDPELITVYAYLGQCEIEGGKPTEGVAHVTRALELAVKAAVEPGMIGEIRMILARGLWLTDRAAAVEAARKAESELAKGGPSTTDDVADAKKWLATHKP